MKFDALSSWNLLGLPLSNCYKFNDELILSNYYKPDPLYFDSLLTNFHHNKFTTCCNQDVTLDPILFQTKFSHTKDYGFTSRKKFNALHGVKVTDNFMYNLIDAEDSKYHILEYISCPLLCNKSNGIATGILRLFFKVNNFYVCQPIELLRLGLIRIKGNICSTFVNAFDSVLDKKLISTSVLTLSKKANIDLYSPLSNNVKYFTEVYEKPKEITLNCFSVSCYYQIVLISNANIEISNKHNIKDLMVYTMHTLKQLQKFISFDIYCPEPNQFVSVNLLNAIQTINYTITFQCSTSLYAPAYRLYDLPRTHCLSDECTFYNPNLYLGNITVGKIPVTITEDNYGYIVFGSLGNIYIWSNKIRIGMINWSKPLIEENSSNITVTLTTLEPIDVTYQFYLQPEPCSVVSIFRNYLTIKRKKNSLITNFPASVKSYTNRICYVDILASNLYVPSYIIFSNPPVGCVKNLTGPNANFFEAGIDYQLGYLLRDEPVLALKLPPYMEKFSVSKGGILIGTASYTDGLAYYAIYQIELNATYEIKLHSAIYKLFINSTEISRDGIPKYIQCLMKGCQININCEQLEFGLSSCVYSSPIPASNIAMRAEGCFYFPVVYENHFLCFMKNGHKVVSKVVVLRDRKLKKYKQTKANVEYFLTPTAAGSSLTADFSNLCVIAQLNDIYIDLYYLPELCVSPLKTITLHYSTCDAEPSYKWNLEHEHISIISTAHQQLFLCVNRSKLLSISIKYLVTHNCVSSTMSKIANLTEKKYIYSNESDTRFSYIEDDKLYLDTLRPLSHCIIPQSFRYIDFTLDYSLVSFKKKEMEAYAMNIVELPHIMFESEIKFFVKKQTVKKLPLYLDSSFNMIELKSPLENSFNNYYELDSTIEHIRSYPYYVEDGDTEDCTLWPECIKTEFFTCVCVFGVISIDLNMMNMKLLPTIGFIGFRDIVIHKAILRLDKYYPIHIAKFGSKCLNVVSNEFLSIDSFYFYVGKPLLLAQYELCLSDKLPGFIKIANLKKIGDPQSFHYHGLCLYNQSSCHVIYKCIPEKAFCTEAVNEFELTNITLHDMNICSNVCLQFINSWSDASTTFVKWRSTKLESVIPKKKLHYMKVFEIFNDLNLTNVSFSDITTKLSTLNIKMPPYHGKLNELTYYMREIAGTVKFTSLSYEFPPAKPKIPRKSFLCYLTHGCTICPDFTNYDDYAVFKHTYLSVQSTHSKFLDLSSGCYDFYSAFDEHIFALEITNVPVVLKLQLVPTNEPEELCNVGTLSIVLDLTPYHYGQKAVLNTTFDYMMAVSFSNPFIYICGIDNQYPSPFVETETSYDPNMFYDYRPPLFKIKPQPVYLNQLALKNHVKAFVICGCNVTQSSSCNSSDDYVYEIDRFYVIAPTEESLKYSKKLIFNFESTLDVYISFYSLFRHRSVRFPHEVRLMESNILRGYHEQVFSTFTKVSNKDAEVYGFNKKLENTIFYLHIQIDHIAYSSSSYNFELLWPTGDKIHFPISVISSVFQTAIQYSRYKYTFIFPFEVTVYESTDSRNITEALMNIKETKNVSASDSMLLAPSLILDELNAKKYVVKVSTDCSIFVKGGIFQSPIMISSITVVYKPENTLDTKKLAAFKRKSMEVIISPKKIFISSETESVSYDQTVFKRPVSIGVGGSQVYFTGRNIFGVLLKLYEDDLVLIGNKLYLSFDDLYFVDEHTAFLLDDTKMVVAILKNDVVKHIVLNYFNYGINRIQCMAYYKNAPFHIIVLFENDQFFGSTEYHFISSRLDGNYIFYTKRKRLERVSVYHYREMCFPTSKKILIQNIDKEEIIRVDPGYLDPNFTNLIWSEQDAKYFTLVNNTYLDFNTTEPRSFRFKQYYVKLGRIHISPVLVIVNCPMGLLMVNMTCTNCEQNLDAVSCGMCRNCRNKSCLDYCRRYCFNKFCQPCVTGKIKASNQLSHCYSVCKTVDMRIVSTKNRYCECQPGEYWDNGCTKCPYGFVCNQMKLDLCPKGMQTMKSGAYSETDDCFCPLNHYLDTDCKECPPGTYAMEKDTSCTKCPDKSLASLEIKGLCNMCDDAYININKQCLMCPSRVPCEYKDKKLEFKWPMNCHINTRITKDLCTFCAKDEFYYLPLVHERCFKCFPDTERIALQSESSSFAYFSHLEEMRHNSICHPKEGYYVANITSSELPFVLVEPEEFINLSYKFTDVDCLSLCLSVDLCLTYYSKKTTCYIYLADRNHYIPYVKSFDKNDILINRANFWTNLIIELCPKDHYCPLNDRNQVIPCPSNSVTADEGATSITHCQCHQGMIMHGSQCILCPSGTYRQFNTANTCELCPLFTTSLAGSVDINSCYCYRGFYIPKGGTDCVPCPPNKICPGGNSKVRSVDPVFCPPNTIVNVVRDSSEISCVCSKGAGLSHMGDEYSKCVLCGPGYYKTKPGDSNCSSRCPINSSSGFGSYLMIHCYCLSGYYKVGSDCMKCPKNAVCNGGFNEKFASLHKETCVKKKKTYECSIPHNVEVTINDHQKPIFYEGLYPLSKERAIRCPNQNACTMRMTRNSCASNYKGVLCDGCVKGCYKLLNQCMRCSWKSHLYYLLRCLLVTYFLLWLKNQVDSAYTNPYNIIPSLARTYIQTNVVCSLVLRSFEVIRTDSYLLKLNLYGLTIFTTSWWLPFNPSCILENSNSNWLVSILLSIFLGIPMYLTTLTLTLYIYTQIRIILDCYKNPVDVHSYYDSAVKLLNHSNVDLSSAAYFYMKCFRGLYFNDFSRHDWDPNYLRKVNLRYFSNKQFHIISLKSFVMSLKSLYYIFMYMVYFPVVCYVILIFSTATFKSKRYFNNNLDLETTSYNPALYFSFICYLCISLGFPAYVYFLSQRNKLTFKKYLLLYTQGYKHRLEICLSVLKLNILVIFSYSLPRVNRFVELNLLLGKNIAHNLLIVLVLFTFLTIYIQNSSQLSLKYKSSHQFNLFSSGLTIVLFMCPSVLLNFYLVKPYVFKNLILIISFVIMIIYSCVFFLIIMYNKGRLNHYKANAVPSYNANFYLKHYKGFSMTYNPIIQCLSLTRNLRPYIFKQYYKLEYESWHSQALKEVSNDLVQLLIRVSVLTETPCNFDLINFTIKYIFSFTFYQRLIQLHPITSADLAYTASAFVPVILTGKNNPPELLPKKHFNFAQKEESFSSTPSTTKSSVLLTNSSILEKIPSSLEGSSLEATTISKRNSSKQGRKTCGSVMNIISVCRNRIPVTHSREDTGSGSRLLVYKSKSFSKLTNSHVYDMRTYAKKQREVKVTRKVKFRKLRSFNCKSSNSHGHLYVRRSKRKSFKLFCKETKKSGILEFLADANNWSIKHSYKVCRGLVHQSYITQKTGLSLYNLFNKYFDTRNYHATRGLLEKRLTRSRFLWFMFSPNVYQYEISGFEFAAAINWFHDNINTFIKAYKLYSHFFEFFGPNLENFSQSQVDNFFLEQEDRFISASRNSEAEYFPKSDVFTMPLYFDDQTYISCNSPKQREQSQSILDLNEKPIFNANIDPLSSHSSPPRYTFLDREKPFRDTF